LPRPQEKLEQVDGVVVCNGVVVTVTIGDVVTVVNGVDVMVMRTASQHCAQEHLPIQNIVPGLGFIPEGHQKPCIFKNMTPHVARVVDGSGVVVIVV